MTQFPGVTGKAMTKALGKEGFAVVRIKGSHHRLEHPEGRMAARPPCRSMARRSSAQV